jgi:restriction system protein
MTKLKKLEHDVKELTPSEFETLVSNLFGKMNLETKLTRTSKDGGGLL